MNVPAIGASHHQAIVLPWQTALFFVSRLQAEAQNA
jgi:hypothetical protein